MVAKKQNPDELRQVRMRWPNSLWNRARIATAKVGAPSVSEWVRSLIEKELKKLGE